MTNLDKRKIIVVEALTKSYTDRDFSELDNWWSPDYIQHNPYIPNKLSGLRNFIEALPKERRYEHGHVFADGDYVIVHGRYSGGGLKALVAVDIFRFENEKIVEHWDVLQEEVPAAQTLTGNPMFK
jgi:predicted SnoaL-like aldol condensation-catalyzing enzyme